jgi:hypothetical protein
MRKITAKVTLLTYDSHGGDYLFVPVFYGTYTECDTYAEIVRGFYGHSDSNPVMEVEMLEYDERKELVDNPNPFVLFGLQRSITRMTTMMMNQSN